MERGFLLSRRDFLISVGALAGAKALERVGPAYAEEGHRKKQFSSLKKYQKYIGQEFSAKRAIVEMYDEAGISLLPGLSPEIFNRNFPFWKAGEIKYDVSWLILGIVHGEETTFSTHASPNSRRFVGAMQRARIWPEEETYEAGKGWEFLAELPQGYDGDWREILWGARYIAERALPNAERYGSMEEASLQALYEYSAAIHARQRIESFRRLKSVLL